MYKAKGKGIYMKTSHNSDSSIDIENLEGLYTRYMLLVNAKRCFHPYN